jgi:hypothetical protein
MCIYCDSTNIVVVDHASGNTICVDCGIVIDREFSFCTQIIESTDFTSISNEEKEFQFNNINIFMNIYCSVTLCMGRREIALIRKSYRHVIDNYPQLVFLHNQEQVVYAIIHTKLPSYFEKVCPTVKKISFKLKDCL